MLYVFHVDTGTMMTFDMSLVSESVTHLKKFVEKACGIPFEKQVLLVSGGECLDPNARVCSYSAGTDTNPIFLFSKSVIESTKPPAVSIDFGSNFDLKDKVKEASDLPADYATVVHRTQLAQHIFEVAKEQTKICERLVHDQHLQQQGWAAVVANLEDITAEFRRRSEICTKSFSDYLSEHDSYLKFLHSFNDDLQMLSKIPMLPALLESEKLFLEAQAPDENDEEEEEVKEEGEKTKPLTLLEWILAADNKSSMGQLFEHCSKGLEQFDHKVFDAMNVEMQHALSTADKPDMKEVKGLGERLYGLEQLMHEAKRVVKEQCDLAQSFQQNQYRAGNIGDRSILPDLCASHRKQLLVMVQNHQQLCDIRRRCTRAKEELSVNLHHRLRWVMYVENTILETSHKLFIYHENLKRLRKHLEVLQQIHLAPATYLTAVAEVVRRRKFSQAFLLWASELACHLLTIHNDEVARRKDFQSQFEGHFLTSLFPGMEDLPPSFATQAPSIFDSTLPKIGPEDVDRLKEALPGFSENLAVPDISAILQFFMLKSEIKAELDRVDDDDDRGVEEKLVQVVNDVGLASNLDQNLLKPIDSETCLVAHGLPHLRDLDKGCESETDTEEFEKVCQSPLELQFDKDIPSPRPGTQDASTLTEDNLQTSRSEQDKLKSILIRMAYLSRQAISQLKSELTELRALYLVEKTNLKQQCESLNNSWEHLSIERDNKEKEIIQRLTADHEMELCDYKKAVEARSEEVQCLRDENACLEGRVKDVTAENSELRKEVDRVLTAKDTEVNGLRQNLLEMEAEREKVLKETRENLNREHRVEIDNIRSRFKLMTTERSPSEPNLEKIGQLKEEYEKQMRGAVERALAAEREKIDEIKADFERERLLILSDIEHRDKQIVKLHNEVKFLKERHDVVESENDSLVTETKREDMAASVGLFEGKVDVATSPVKHRDKLTKSQTSLIKSGKLSIDSCSLGDIVLVIWDQRHENYMILQESNTLYFLHTDCLETLGLKRGENEERKTYCVGQVTNKDYCHARKAQNRYKVPVGTKFYRVTTKPVILNTDMTKSAEPSTSSTPAKHQPLSESQTTERTVTDSGPSSTPASPILSTSNMESSIATQDVNEAIPTQDEAPSSSTMSESNRSPGAVHLYSTSVIRYDYVYDGVCDLLKVVILYLYLFEDE